jgi:hypothetical protein
MQLGYSGFILLKQIQGKNIFQIKLKGSLEEINKIFKTHKIEFDGEQVELIYSKELDRLKNRASKTENEGNNIDIKEIKEYKEKESKEEPLLAAMRKRTMENETLQREKENDDLKIKEMKERIQKYKNELRKGDYMEELMMKAGRKQRFSYYSQHNDELEINLNDLDKKKSNIENSEFLLKNQNINKNNVGIDKKQYNTINNEKDAIKEKEKKEEKEKDRDRSYSRAMERLKRRNKRDNSAELKSKKSNKINEMAKQLESVLGKGNVSTEIRYDNNISTEIINENEPQENNFEEMMENKPVVSIVSKKPKRPQKFQI